MDVNAGVYFNQNSVFGSKAYPGIDIGYKINEALRIYGNAGMGQRLPTFTDLYYVGPNNVGNANLKPEFMSSYEAGVKYFKDKFYANASVFHKDGRAFIDWVRPDTGSTWMVQNFTGINTTGLHIDAGYKIEWSKNSLNLFTGYTYLNPQIGTIADQSKQHWQSQYAVNALQHQWIARASLSLHEQWQISIANRLINRLNAGNAIAGYAKKSYQLTDFRLDYKLKSIAVDIAINNIFDIKYIESGVVPLPGLWLSLGLRYQLK